jgi:chemotaxis protein histidine kinase CheA
VEALETMKASLVATATCLAACVAALGQEKLTEQPHGLTTVSGRVYCGDTNAPARLAKVMLQPVDVIDSMTSQSNKQTSSHCYRRGEAEERQDRCQQDRRLPSL